MPYKHSYSEISISSSESRALISDRIINIVVMSGGSRKNDYKPVSLLLEKGIKPHHLSPLENQIILRECYRLDLQERSYDLFTLTIELNARHKNTDWQKLLGKIVAESIAWEILPEYARLLLQAEEIGLQPGAVLTIEQIIKYDLYSDPWICVGGILYKWKDSYYQASQDGLEKRKIADFLDTYITQEKGKTAYIYAESRTAQRCLNWVKDKSTIDPASVNPPGLNCKNGILQIHWKQIGRNKVKPVFKLVSHDSDSYYLYPPLVEYKPDYTSPDCDQMLKCLEPKELDIFLKTIAASLDMGQVRKYCGRAIRAILCYGKGSNGKDTLKKATQILFGYQGVSNASLSDFSMYDQGRKFAISKIENCRINWASENSHLKAIDKIDSLKQFVTGEDIDIEKKNKDSYSIEPKAAALFNVNDIPNLEANQESILSRFAILRFNKSFKVSEPLGEGELLADPRFRYDDEWLIDEVMPAFLNKILDALERLMDEGIDYEIVDTTISQVKTHNSHLLSFCQDCNLNYCPDGRVEIRQLWDVLEQWYFETGTLTIRRDKNDRESDRQWIPQAIHSDKNVRGMNQVRVRFLELFPKAEYMPRDNYEIIYPYLKGLAFVCPIK